MRSAVLAGLTGAGLPPDPDGEGVLPVLAPDVAAAPGEVIAGPRGLLDGLELMVVAEEGGEVEEEARDGLMLAGLLVADGAGLTLAVVVVAAGDVFTLARLLDAAEAGLAFVVAVVAAGDGLMLAEVLDAEEGAGLAFVAALVALAAEEVLVLAELLAADEAGLLAFVVVVVVAAGDVVLVLVDTVVVRVELPELEELALAQ